jgi:hypothetical protein
VLSERDHVSDARSLAKGLGFAQDDIDSLKRPRSLGGKNDSKVVGVLRYARQLVASQLLGREPCREYRDSDKSAPNKIQPPNRRSSEVPVLVVGVVRHCGHFCRSCIPERNQRELIKTQHY